MIRLLSRLLLVSFHCWDRYRYESARGHRAALLLDNKVKISMDGRGAWRDNVFVEGLWRSVKYEEVYRYVNRRLDSRTAFE